MPVAAGGVKSLRRGIEAWGTIEQVTLADLVEDRLPDPIATLASRQDSWLTR